MHPKENRWVGYVLELPGRHLLPRRRHRPRPGARRREDGRGVPADRRHVHDGRRRRPPASRGRWRRGWPCRCTTGSSSARRATGAVPRARRSRRRADHDPGEPVRIGVIATTPTGRDRRSLHLGSLFAAAVVVGVAVWFAARAFAARVVPRARRRCGSRRAAGRSWGAWRSASARSPAPPSWSMDLTSAGLRRTAESHGRGAPDRVPRTVVRGRQRLASLARRLRGDTDARTRLRRRPVHPGVRPSRVVREEVLRDRGDAVARGRAPHRRRQDRDLRGVPGRAGGRRRSRLRRDPGRRAVRRRDRERASVGAPDARHAGREVGAGRVRLRVRRRLRRAHRALRADVQQGARPVQPRGRRHAERPAGGAPQAALRMAAPPRAEVPVRAAGPGRAAAARVRGRRRRRGSTRSCGRT